jgi:predicted dehydrogenase
MIRVGVIGYGYWGPNILRNFAMHDDVQVVALCDLSEAALRRAKKIYPALRVTQRPEDITQATDIDVVAVITPVSSHYPLALDALRNGKHVFVEKPFTASSAQAQTLIDLAEAKGLTIMVDHTFLFTSAVKTIRNLIKAGDLGKLLYYHSTRINLGLFQHDVNVVWDLAPHDLSIMDYLLPCGPTSVSAVGMDHYNRGLEDQAYVTVCFEDRLLAHFNFNWISPVKVRETLIGGDKKMLVWNDVVADEKLKVYDKGVNLCEQDVEGRHHLMVQYRVGDMYSPQLDTTEALKLEIDYFVQCLQQRKTPFNDGRAGLRIVRMLEAADQSIRENGRPIVL